MAPALHAWVEQIARGETSGHRPNGQLAIHMAHAPLFAWVAATFMPLMQQNYAAWERHRDRGETRFNEAAFAAGRALYDGILLGRPFRSVAKTFQVRVWRGLLAEWNALPIKSENSWRTYILSLVPRGRTLTWGERREVRDHVQHRLVVREGLRHGSH